MVYVAVEDAKQTFQRVANFAQTSKHVRIRGVPGYERYLNDCDEGLGVYDQICDGIASFARTLNMEGRTRLSSVMHTMIHAGLKPFDIRRTARWRTFGHVPPNLRLASLNTLEFGRNILRRCLLPVQLAI